MSGFPEGPQCGQLQWTLHSLKTAAALREAKVEQRTGQKLSRDHQEEAQVEETRGLFWHRNRQDGPMATSCSSVP